MAGIFGFAEPIDEDFDDFAPLDVIEQLRRCGTIHTRSLGDISDTRTWPEPIPMLRLSQAIDREARKRQERIERAWREECECGWSTPTIELARHLYWGEWNGRPRIFERRWSAPQLVEDKSLVPIRMIRWTSLETGETVNTLTTERMGRPWVAVSEWTHYEQYGAGLARIVVPPP
jgi:hypothetical protein